MSIDSLHGNQSQKQEMFGVDDQIEDSTKTIPGTESQVAEAEAVLNSARNSKISFEQGFLDLVTEATEIAKTDWNAYSIEMNRISNMWPAAREMLPKPSIDKQRKIEESNMLLMSSNSSSRAEGIKRIRMLDDESQQKIAEDYFNSTIGQGEMPVLNSLAEQYEIYNSLRGSKFSQKFKELEDARLTKYGHGTLTL